MANLLHTEQLAPASRVRAAILGAALTVLVLAGGLVTSFMVGFATFQTLSKEFVPIYTSSVSYGFGGVMQKPPRCRA